MVDPLDALEDHSYSLNVKYSLSSANLNDHNFFFLLIFTAFLRDTLSEFYCKSLIYFITQGLLLD